MFKNVELLERLTEIEAHNHSALIKAAIIELNTLYAVIEKLEILIDNLEKETGL